MSILYANNPMLWHSFPEGQTFQIFFSGTSADTYIGHACPLPYYSLKKKKGFFQPHRFSHMQSFQSKDQKLIFFAKYSYQVPAFVLNLLVEASLQFDIS